MPETYVSDHKAHQVRGAGISRGLELNPKTNAVARYFEDRNRRTLIVERAYFGVFVEGRDLRVEFDTREEWAARAQFAAFCREIGA